MSEPWKEVVASLGQKKFSVYRHDKDPANLWLESFNRCAIHYYAGGSSPHSYGFRDGNILVLRKHIVWQTSGQMKSEKIEAGNVPARLLKVTKLVAYFLDIGDDQLQCLADSIWQAYCKAHGQFTPTPTPLHIPLQKEDAQSGSTRGLFPQVRWMLSQHSRASHSSDDKAEKRKQTLQEGVGRQWLRFLSSCFRARKQRVPEGSFFCPN